jgi:hypothetical protein
MEGGVKAFNLTLRFVLELCAIGALGYAGWRVGGPIWQTTAATVVLGVGGAAIWGIWVAPRASYPLRDPLRLIPEWVVFGGATVALAVTGHPILATALAVLAALNRIALWRLGVGTGGETLHPTKDETRQPDKNETPQPDKNKTPHAGKDETPHADRDETPHADRDETPHADKNEARHAGKEVGDGGASQRSKKDEPS